MGPNRCAMPSGGGWGKYGQSEGAFGKVCGEGGGGQARREQQAEEQDGKGRRVSGTG